MAEKRGRTVTVKMPGGPDLEVAVDRILVPPGKKIDLAFPVVSQERRKELREIETALKIEG